MLLSTVVLLLASARWTGGEYMGCYGDNEIRIMPDFTSVMPNVNSPERCMHVCQLLQFQYTGLQVSDECFCSSDRPYELMKKNDSECSYKCPYSDTPCGGGYRMSIYSSDSKFYPTTEPGSYIGCYVEPQNDRTINNFQVYLWQINSPKRCVHICTSLGYMYAGVVPGFWCFCGNTKPINSRKAQESECQVACPHSKEKCGGDGRIAAYRTSVDPNAESIVTVSDERLKSNELGCFEDSEHRILSEFSISLDDTNSPKNCLYLCQQLRYLYAGVHNGKECYCGNDKPSPTRLRNVNECQTSCPQGTEMCGGDMRIHVFSTNMYPTLSHLGLNSTDVDFP